MDDLLYFNGINANTGEYLLSPRPSSQIADLAKGEPLEGDRLYTLTERYEREKIPDFAPRFNVNPKNLSETGWGVIFAHHDPNRAVLQAALQPLLNHRQQQAGELYRIYTYYPGESASDFLQREGKTQGIGPANPHDLVDPAKISYYLLIVGDPGTIPYEFQYQLDVQYAVGRIYFDTLNGYADLQAFADYARSVIASETQAISLTPTAHFFGVSNPDDPATQLSAEHLVKPLYTKISQYQQKQQQAWTVQMTSPEAATVARLSELLGGNEQTPALLFTASHGAAFEKGDSRQLIHQGALICQDWLGPKATNAQGLGESLYFSADKIGEDAQLLGLIAFHFACFGAGTPENDEFGMRGQFPALADRPFLARLPQRLLGHPRGGALAVVGHVERAWGCSFTWQGDTGHLTPFEDALMQLMEGYPIGYALEPFHSRYAALSAGLTQILHDARQGFPIDDRELAYQWTANNDARGYTILGDPAVKVMVKPDIELQGDRPILEKIVIPASLVSVPMTTPASPTDADPQLTDPSSFGLFSRKSDPTAPKPEGLDPLGQLSSKLQQLVSDLSTTLSNVMNDFAVLEVTTYTSDNMTAINEAALSSLSQSEAIKLRAMTQIKLDGDTRVIVPANEDGEVDEVIWKIHMDTVQQAQHHRAEMFKATVSVTADLLKSLKLP